VETIITIPAVDRHSNCRTVGKKHPAGRRFLAPFGGDLLLLKTSGRFLSDAARSLDAHYQVLARQAIAAFRPWGTIATAVAVLPVAILHRANLSLAGRASPGTVLTRLSPARCSRITSSRPVHVVACRCPNPT